MKNKIRVLVVDDDPEWRKDSQKNLERWGYHPIIAEKFGHFLMDDAIEKCFKHSCHIALIDMNLFARPENRDGFKLVEQLKPATPIIVTGHHSRNAMREAYRTYDVKNFIGKDEGPKSLKEAIAQAVEEDWEQIEFKNENTPEIDLPGKILSINLVKRFKQNGVTDLRDDAIIKALRRHFKDAGCVTLESWEQVNEFESLDLNRRGRSAVFRADVVNKEGKHLRPVVIKIARRERAEQEKKNFEQYIEEHINSLNFARVTKMTAMWHIGIIQYEYATENPYQRNEEAPLGTFKKFFLEENVETINSLIKRLFGPVWNRHFEDRELLRTSIFQGYSDVWKGNGEPDYLLRKLENFLRESDCGDQMTINGIQVLNPIRWIVDRACELDTSPGAKLSSSAITHGDLHSDNILVYGKQEPVLIDFERTGPGPVFQDFALLSVDILIRILNSRVAKADRALIFSRVIWDKWNAPKDFTKPLKLEYAQKVIQSIDQIREIAFDKEVSHFKHEKNFLWGLLLNVGFRAALLQKLLLQPDIDVESGVKIKRVETSELETVLLLGGLICEKLSNFKRSSPPEEVIQWLRSQSFTIIARDGVSISQKISDKFNMSELRVACTELIGNEYENFPQIKREFIIEFLGFMKRNDRESHLKEYLINARPYVDWDQFDWFDEE